MTVPDRTMVPWIDVMGADHVEVEALVMYERVFVDDKNLRLMARSIIESGLYEPKALADLVDALWDAPLDDVNGLWDVTEAGGGWAVWSSMGAA